MKDLNLRINKANVLFFDLDGTLVDTKLANYLSYKKAIQQIIRKNIDDFYNSNERFNRKLLKKIIPELKETEYHKIIKEKNRLYINYLPETRLNEEVGNVLTKYYKTNKTILVTNCREERAIVTLKYHNLIDKFSHMFYKQKPVNGSKVNKYSNALIKLNILPASVFVFENEKIEVTTAIQAGIPKKNIITV